MRQRGEIVSTHPRHFLFRVDLVVFGGRCEIEISLAVAIPEAHSIELVFTGSAIETESRKR